MVKEHLLGDRKDAIAQPPDAIMTLLTSSRGAPPLGQGPTIVLRVTDTVSRLLFQNILRVITNAVNVPIGVTRHLPDPKLPRLH